VSGVETVEVKADEAEMRLDRWFKRHFPAIGHGHLQRLLRTGQIRVDGARAKASLRLTPGQRVRIPPVKEPDAAQLPARPTRAAARVAEAEAARLVRLILYRDGRILAIDKPAGLAVQGGTKTDHHLDGMLDALRLDGDERPRLVHRLDQDTSGVLVLARTAAAARELTALFRTRDVHKVYWAVVTGRPKVDEGTIDAALLKRPGHKGERVVVDDNEGKRAVTRYRVLDSAGNRAALVELEPLTGRTHQLRAHMAAIGTPILGDGKYGGQAAFLPMPDIARRLHLHARSLTLPGTGGRLLAIKAPLPPHLRATMKLLGLAAG